jgi:hypothetical protein
MGTSGSKSIYKDVAASGQGSLAGSVIVRDLYQKEIDPNDNTNNI